MKLNLYPLVGLLSFTLLAPTQAQENYDVAKIPAELLKNSTAVVRHEQMNVVVKSVSSATETYKTAVTILSKNADGLSQMSAYYDKFTNVYNLKATMYDAKGLKIKTYKSSDFKDRSMVSSGTLFDDNRIKELEFLNSNYPYTIEYSYERDYNGYLGFPYWVPVRYYDTAVEKSVFSLQLPKTISFKSLKSKGLKADSSVVNNNLIYNWSCTNFPSVEHEQMSIGLSEVTPWVKASPVKFEYDHFAGNMESWKNLGTWLYQLTTDGQTIPENTKGIVKGLIAGAKTDKEKIAILYQYLQSNTRYVGVQLGIGGLRPIAAEKVASVNYGDCKALSNYMMVLLKEAGIKSDIVILGSGMPSMLPDYASFGQSNHAILCVPLGKDTTWLECTSQYKPMGYIGNDNSGRNVLLITEGGGKLVKSPVYKPQDNFQNRTTSVALTPEGSAAIRITTLYGASQYEDNLGMMLIEPTDQRKRLMNSLGIPNMDISSASYTQPDKTKPVIEEKIELKSTQMMSQGGEKLFLTLNLLNRRESVPRKIENRKTSFAVPYGYEDTDQITYTLPQGYKAEYLPKDITLESEFGKYTAKVVIKDNALVYTRSQMMNSKQYPPEKYQDLVDFYKKIYLADKQKAILAKVN